MDGCFSVLFIYADDSTIWLRRIKLDVECIQEDCVNTHNTLFNTNNSKCMIFDIYCTLCNDNMYVVYKTYRLFNILYIQCI